jgi:hypothetical protein
MLQMLSVRRIALLVILAWCGCMTVTSAKCADSLIRAYGDIAGPIGPNLRMTMEIRPDPRRTMPVIRVVKPEFEIEANFDNFLFEIAGSDRCGRTLESVALVVLDGDKEITRVNLDIKKDLVRDARTRNYTVRQRLKIQIPAS